MNRRSSPLFVLAAALLAALALPAPAPAPLRARPKPPAAPAAPAQPGPAAPPAAPAVPASPGESPAPARPPDQPSPPPLLGAGTVYARGQYLGPAPCAAAGCHGNTAPTQVYGVLQNEFSTWFHEDKHRRAFDPLRGERSALIARNMKLSRPASESALCLGCHALSAPKPVEAHPLEREDGISCEACHGPAGGWIARHNEAGWSHADSLAAGMVDLRSARVRAQVCLSCHQGEGRRQVNHELLAAGHPELVFELDNYAEAMPAHWLPFSARKDAATRRDTHGLHAWAVGQVESFRQGLELLSHRAQSETWPEFAELVCDTCHHDLAAGAWRQKRGYERRAGLPSWSPARYAVLHHLIAAVASRDDDTLTVLDAAMREVAAAVGNLGAPPPALLAASGRAVSLLDPVGARVAKATWDARSARSLLAAILADRAGPPSADRESAEQTALAIQSLTAHLSATQPRFTRGKPAQLLRQIFAELDDPHGFNRERFVALLAEIEGELGS